MAYSNINLTPSRKKYSGPPCTGWARPDLDLKFMREWYDNFEDWQSKLPKTDYSLSPSSEWYAHEWVPGVPVMPNLSRPPLHQNYKQRFTSYQTTRSRFITTPDDSLLTGNGCLSPEQDYYQEVWYKRIIYTIRTVLITITTTIISSTVGDDVSEARNRHTHQNGVRTLDFSDSDEEFTNTNITSETLDEESLYTKYTNIFKAVFSRLMSIFGLVFYAVVAGFFSFYRSVANLEAYCLKCFHNMLGLSSSHRRYWALLLLLIVPYLILFAWGYGESRNQTPVHTEAKDQVGLISMMASPFVAAFGSIMHLINKFGVVLLPSPPTSTGVPVTSPVEPSVPAQPLPTPMGTPVPVIAVHTSREVVQAQATMTVSEVESIVRSLLQEQKTSEGLNAKMKLQYDEFVATVHRILEGKDKLITLQNEEQQNNYKDLDAKIKIQHDALKTLLDEFGLEVKRLNSQENHQQQMYVDVTEKISSQLVQQEARFKKQLEELHGMLFDLQKKYEKILMQKTENCNEVVAAASFVDHETDLINIPDYALKSSGGSVLSIRCTKSVTVHMAYVLFGFDIPWSSSSDSINVIQPSINPGECWCFVGSEGHLVIGLSENITITAVTLEHAHKNLLPPGKFASAPNKFTLLGLETVEDFNGTTLGTFAYEDNGKSLQHFETLRANRSFNIVEMHIQSNHGGEFTCVYRVRIHGDPEEQE